MKKKWGVDMGIIEKLEITPGPWEVTGAYDHLIAQIGNDNATEIIAELWKRRMGHKPDVPGDAYLIAAAPEMLEALIDIIRFQKNPIGSVNEPIRNAENMLIGKFPQIKELIC